MLRGVTKKMKEKSKLFPLKKVKRDLVAEKKIQEFQELYWNYVCVYTSRQFGSYYGGYRYELKEVVEKTQWWECRPKGTSSVYWLGETLRRLTVASILSWFFVLYLCGQAIFTGNLMPPLWLTLVAMFNIVVISLRSLVHRKRQLEMCRRVSHSSDVFVELVQKTSKVIGDGQEIKAALRILLANRRKRTGVDQAIERLDEVISTANVHLQFFTSTNEIYVAGALKCKLSNDQEMKVMAAMPNVVKVSKLIAKSKQIVEKIRSHEEEEQDTNFLDRQVSLITDIQSIRENIA